MLASAASAPLGPTGGSAWTAKGVLIFVEFTYRSSGKGRVVHGVGSFYLTASVESEPDESDGVWLTAVAGEASVVGDESGFNCTLYDVNDFLLF